MQKALSTWKFWNALIDNPGIKKEIKSSKFIGEEMKKEHFVIRTSKCSESCTQKKCLILLKEQRENRATYYSGNKEKQNKHKKLVR